MANGTAESSRARAAAAADGVIGPVKSILDTDLYKLTMQQAVLQHFPEAHVTYKFTNRSQNMRFTRSSIAAIEEGIQSLEKLALTDEEDAWLGKRCPYFRPQYRSYLRAYRFRPREHIHLNFEPEGKGTADESQRDGIQASAVADSDEEWGQLHLTVEGKWADVILYEVPLMAVVSATYFTTVDRRWSVRGQRALARQKARSLVGAGVKFSEFGTRRRRSYETHKLVMEGLLQGERDAQEMARKEGREVSGKVSGTSNVHFANIFDVLPVGTMAHEWTMGIAALQGYNFSNLRALQYWDAIYSPPNFQPKSPADDLTIALTDTFSTRVFWKDLLSTDAGHEIARRWRGLRQDSGDSKDFARRAKAEYEKLGIDPQTKVIIYSDGLNVNRCLDLMAFSQEIGIGAAFGVGTFLTNDFVRDDEADSAAELDGRNAASNVDPDDIDWVQNQSERPPSKALNIVIKLNSLNGHSAVKISDELTKNTGDPDEIALCKRRFGIEAAGDGVDQRVEDG